VSAANAKPAKNRKMDARLSFATAMHAPIDLPEQVLTVIVSLLRDVAPADAVSNVRSRSLYACVMRGIGSVSKAWRRLANGVLMGDELAHLSATGAAAAAECLSAFPRAQSLRVVGNARVGDIVAVLGSRRVIRLQLTRNSVVRGCERLGQLVGLRALYLTQLKLRVRDVGALSALVGLQSLRLIFCKLGAASLMPVLARMTQLTSLGLGLNRIGDVGGGVIGARTCKDDAADVAGLRAQFYRRCGGGVVGTVARTDARVLVARPSASLHAANVAGPRGSSYRRWGAASLAPELAPMTQLTSLDLGYNRIGAAGATSLAPTLALMT
jgi:hypothetical protein